MSASYLCISASHQVFQLHDFVIDGGAVPFLNSIVGRALLPFVWLASRLTTDSDAVDGKLFSIHHDRHCSQDSTPTHECLRKQDDVSARVNIVGVNSTAVHCVTSALGLSSYCASTCSEVLCAGVVVARDVGATVVTMQGSGFKVVSSRLSALMNWG